jgi:Rad3-related DNA helicase
MKCFPGKPRPIQEEALRIIEKAWDTHDVFVVSLPVGAGKSRIALTISRWAKQQTRILTPTNILVEQYLQDAPHLNHIKKKADYCCSLSRSEEPESCAQVYKDNGGRHCMACHYVDKVRKTKMAKQGVYNYYTYVALKLQAPVVIFDEAHKVLDAMRGFAAKRIWQFQHDYPNWVNTYGTLHKWVTGRVQQLPGNKPLRALKEDLELGSTRYLVKRGMEDYRGEERDCISLLPLDVSQEPPILWAKANKIVLMSGTISYKDIEAMGLHRKRVCYIDLPSPIDATSRPVHFVPIAPMGHATQGASLPKMAEWVRAALVVNPGKGIIHATYSVAQQLRELLADVQRLRWHDEADKLDVYRAFRETTEPVVLVASGLYEGIDLYGSDYQWQAITKIPYPSLGEPAIKFKAEKDPTWYQWETLKSVIQACGRICRGPDDYGITYILDSNWSRLYNDGRKANLIPQWWQEGYHAAATQGTGKPAAWKTWDASVATQHEDIHVRSGAGEGQQGGAVDAAALSQSSASLSGARVRLPTRRWATYRSQD